MADPTPDACDDWCVRAAAAQLLGPLRPDATVCAHGVRRRLDDVFPPRRRIPDDEDPPEGAIPLKSENTTFRDRRQLAARYIRANQGRH